MVDFSNMYFVLVDVFLFSIILQIIKFYRLKDFYTYW